MRGDGSYLCVEEVGGGGGVRGGGAGCGRCFCAFPEGEWVVCKGGGWRENVMCV